MPTHNYICTNSHIEADVFFLNAQGGAPKTRQCPECGEPSQVHFGSMGTFNRLLSTAGYSNRQADPQTGVQYEHAAHKHQVLREQGRVEGDVMHPDDILQEGHDWRAAQLKKQAFIDANVIQAESLDELSEAIGTRTEMAEQGESYVRLTSANTTIEE